MSAKNMSTQKKLPCPPELWPEFSALLDEALDLTDAERPAWLEGLGPEFATVVPWLRKVLSGSSQTLDTGFLSAVVVDHDLPEFRVGQQVGPYVLKQRLGTGGMGEVWLASRSDGTLNRQVALKLPHTHLLAGVIKRRFERERDILAALSHPHIAQLYDAGVADAQHPYLAMEWVDGTSIIEHCVDQRLSLDRRLDLFLQILEAVGYAHGRLIAHRDLKPSNILVTRDGQVKLLDFGIAKLLNPEAETGATQLTKVGNCMATPAYAAPEQLAGEPITVSADLYALGVLLHELLTGRRPYRDNRRASPDRTEPGRASSRIEEGHAPTVGGIDTQKLRRALAGDLDAIIAKALEVDPANRYSTAEAFATDLKRSRENRPITARRISAGMLMLKFVRRHRVGVAMSALLLFTLVGASTVIAVYAVRAEREAQRATTIKDFLIGVFRASDPRIASDKPRGEITARELLDVSSKQIESAFSTQPKTQIELLDVTAEIYRELDETQRSSALYARETALAGKLSGEAQAEVIDGLLGQADNADSEGDDVKALKLLDEAEPLIRRAKLDKTASQARWLMLRGEALSSDQSKSSESLADIEAAVALFESSAPKDFRYAQALTDLGVMHEERLDYPSAAKYYQRAIAVGVPNALPEGNLLLSYARLALCLTLTGDFKGATAAFDQAIAIAARTYGPGTRSYWAIASDRAQFVYERGERAAALADFEALLQYLPPSPDSFRNSADMMEAAQVLRKYGYCLAIDGQGTRAVELLERAQAMLKLSQPHPVDNAELESNLGTAYAAAGRSSDAKKAFLTALNARKAVHDPPPQVAKEYWRRGLFLLSEKDLDAAALDLTEAARLSNGSPTEADAIAQAGLAEISIGRGDAKAASDYSSKAMADLTALQGYYDARAIEYVWRVRAMALELGGDLDAARELAGNALSLGRRYYSDFSTERQRVEALARTLGSEVVVRRSPMADAQ